MILMKTENCNEIIKLEEIRLPTINSNIVEERNPTFTNGVCIYGQYLDVIGFNRYNGWYSNPGKLETIQGRVEDEAQKWFTKYNRPVFMAEYGADTVAGLHMSPSYVFTEDYQVELLSEHFKAFDRLRKKDFFIGEMIWNFADFNTVQNYHRVVGNKKGIFTRERQPKASAHQLRKRYWSLANELDKVTIPSDVFSYITDVSVNYTKTEL